MDDYQPEPEIQTPQQRIIVIASAACFFSLLIIYRFARSVVELLGVPWIEFLAYAVVPIAVTFVILYNSCWHGEISGAARTGYLLLLSSVILGGVLVAIAYLLCVGVLAATFFNYTGDPG